MLSRFASVLLLGSLLLLPSALIAGTPPTIKIVVPGFQYPQAGVTSTTLTGVANNGTVTGVTNLGSFLRYADGTFSPLFNVPGATTTEAASVNSSNLVCGTYLSGSGFFSGFFFDGTTFSYYSASGSQDTWLYGLNDEGDFCGYYDIPEGSPQRASNPLSPEDYNGFAVIGGKLTYVYFPEAEAVFPATINNRGQVGGYYLAASDEHYHSFFDYNYPLDPRGAQEGFINGSNDSGILVGTYTAADRTNHAFVLKSSRIFISYDYPGGTQTHLTGINNSRLITGYYYDGAQYLSFIGQLVRPPTSR